MKATFNLLTYGAAKVDIWLVGERLSTAATGVYDRAVNLIGQPITVLGKLGDSVLFSGMSSLQDNETEMKKVTLRATHLVSLLTLPLTLALVFQAEGITCLLREPICGSRTGGSNLVRRCLLSRIDQIG